MGTIAKKSVCIFPHYYDLPEIPYYVIFYISQLIPHFDEIIIVSNPREISNRNTVESDKVKLIFHTNEGYDLGKFLKAFNQLHLADYHKIAFINDSNIVFGKIDKVFTWATENSFDFWGLVEATIQPPYSTHKDNYHIRSHFMVFNEKAISLLAEFLEDFKFDEISAIKNVKETKRRVINDWEIGLSQFLLRRGMKMAGYVKHAPKIEGSSDQFYQRMIKEGVPVIKKKVITSLLPKDLFAGENTWANLIKNYHTAPVDAAKLLKELKNIRKRYVLKKLKFF